jgi:Cu-processing system ATP-binding protein
MNKVDRQTTTDAALTLSAVCKQYGKRCVVNNVNIQVAPGESLAIIGHNGAGKTTLMKLILRLSRPTSGEITHGVNKHESAKAAATRIGFLPEVVAFPANVTGLYMLGFYARLKGQPIQQVNELLELVGLEDAAKRRIGTYSKGMRQRLGLAQALLGAPELLLLDEPTSGLDPFLRRSFYEIINQCQRAGTAIIISSHALTEIEAQTDRIAILHQGMVVTQGSLTQLRDKANLPVLFELETAIDSDNSFFEQICNRFNGRRLSATRLCIEVPLEEKMSMIAQLSQRQDICDIAVNPPGLDALYSHYVEVPGQ